MRRTGAVVVLLFTMFAAAGAETYRFTLEEAIGYGLANSTTIQSKRLAVAAAQADLAAAKSGYYPSLSGGVNWTHLFEQPEIPATIIPADTLGPGIDAEGGLYEGTLLPRRGWFQADAIEQPGHGLGLHGA